jgi:hypothetical protein
MSLPPSSRIRIDKVMIRALACLLLGAVSLFAQGEQAFKGQVTKQGRTYFLYDAKSKTTYQVDQQKKFKAFAGQYVYVIGSLDASGNTIHADDITRVLPPKIIQAKSVYIYCDGCVRGMAKAKPAAFEELTAWNRFKVVASPHQADLIFIFSPTPTSATTSRATVPTSGPSKLKSPT